MVRGCGFVPAYSQKGGDILKKFLRFFNGLSNFLLTIGCVLLIACAAFVNATVFLRYIFHVSFQWAEEISRYLHIGVVILLCGPLLWMGGHINMDLLLLKLKGRTRKVVRIIGEIATLGLVSFTFYNSIIYVSSLYETHILTFSSKFGQWMPTMIIPVGFFFATVFCIALIIREILQFKQEDSADESLTAEIEDILESNELQHIDIGDSEEGK